MIRCAYRTMLVPALSLCLLVVSVTAWAQDFTVIRGGTVIVGSMREPIENGVILIEGDKIRAVGPTEVVDIPDGATEIDATDKFLIPGLADMHVHLEYFDDPKYFALFLANGVTTVRNMDGRPYILEWRQQVASGELLGPTIYTAGPILDGDLPLRPDKTAVANEAEARTLVREQAAGYDFIKVYSNLSRGPYEAVISEARELGLPVAGHVPQGLQVTDLFGSGQVTIEHLGDYSDVLESDGSPFAEGWHWSKLYLGIPIDRQKVLSIAQEQARSGVSTVPTIVQADRGLARLETVDRWLEADDMQYVEAEAREFWLDSIRQNARRMDAQDWAFVERGRQNRMELARSLHAAGVRLLVGTDTPNPFVVPGYSLHEELRNFIDAGYSPEEGLAAATSDAADFLGDHAEWGTLEPGKRADILLLEADPFEDIGNASHIAGVFVRGKYLSRDELNSMLDLLREP